MRIAVFYNLSFGGAKRVVQEHVKGLTKLGHRVDIYSTQKQDDIFDPGIFAHKEYIYKFELDSAIIPFIGRIIRDYQTFYVLKKLHEKIAKDIDEKKYDIVLVHTDTYTQAPFILKFLKTKNVYFCLEPLRIVYEYSLNIPKELAFTNRIYEKLNRRIRKGIDCENARSATHTLAISYFGREYMIHAFNLFPKISYLGVNEKKFHPVRKNKKNQVLFVAEREYIYGYDLAEAAINLIPKNIRPTLKVIFGTEKKQRISEESLIKHYNESLVTLSLSRYDTFGLVPLESMACEVPVIAINVAGYRETINNDKTGYLVDDNPEEIAEKIIKYIMNPELAKSMGKMGRNNIVANWTWEKQINNLEKTLKSFIAN